ncbi:helix-turn-helix transcriptional regulator [Kitasatospora camelliae]|uniref:Helix-turn-helix transcriptional regulator n=1 Tax=Kitasatospora camelliae TaxID=3156397 RepID=A0AAU8K3M5_9ACTN
MGGEPWSRLVERALAPGSAESVLLLVAGPAGSGKSHLIAELLGGTDRSPADGPAPALLVAEDVHLAAPDELARLRALLAVDRPGTAVLLSYRPEELPVPGLALGGPVRYPSRLAVHPVPVPPLGPAEVARIAARVLGPERCRPELTARLHARTAGNAGAVLDLLHALRSAAGPARPGPADLDALDIPVRVAELAISRAWNVPADRRAVVWAAAVLGEPATAGQLAAVAGLDPEPGREALVAALAAGALAECGEQRYGFPMPLAGEAVYRHIPGPVRDQLHRRAARLLARAQPVRWDLLARHHRRSGELRHWLRAVERAAAGYARAGRHQEAVPLLEDALAAPDTPAAARARLAPLLARSATVGLRSDETVRVLRQIVEDRELPAPVRGQVRLDLGLLLGNQAGRGADGREELARAVADLGERPAAAARGMSALAVPYWPGGSLAEHLEWLRRAERVAESSGDPVVRTAVAANGVAVLLSIGDPAGWQRLQALRGSGEEPEIRQQVARGLCNAADAAHWLGYDRQAGELSVEGRRLASSSGAPYTERTVRGTALLLDWAAGRWDGLAARAREFAAEVGDMPLLAEDARLVLGLLALARGEPGQVEAWLRGGRARPVEECSVPLAAASSAALVRLALGRQDTAGAAAEALAAWARLRRQGVWVWAAELAPWAVRALAEAGDPAGAARLTGEFTEGLAGRDAPAAEAALHWCRALTARTEGDHPGALAHFRAAADAHARLGRPYPHALVLEDSARCALATAGPDHPWAVEALGSAAQQLAALGAQWDAARVRALLRTHRPARVRRPVGRPAYGEELSPRELEVAELAGRGMTNREIALTLHLSPRTVEQHVQRAMRKRNVRSRQELTGTPAGGPAGTGATGGGGPLVSP